MMAGPADEKEGAMTWSGGCLCGKLRYEASETPASVSHCHCTNCRRQTGAAFATWLWYPAASAGGGVVWLGEEPAVYRSSPGVARGFCPVCGSTLTFAWPERGEINLSVGSLDDPAVVRPSEHIFAEQRCAWLRLDDGLPAHDRYAPGDQDREPD
jgi:hypothetical protein